MVLGIGCVFEGGGRRRWRGGRGAPKRIEAKHNEFIRDKERSRDMDRVSERES